MFAMEILPVFSPSALIEFRHAKGMSQEELARAAGLATVTVAKLEEGRKRDPRSSTLAKLAGALGCSVGQLMGSSQ